MSKVWDRVVEDLSNYTPIEKKSFWQKLKDMFGSNCNTNCNQGRKCDCCE